MEQDEEEFLKKEITLIKLRVQAEELFNSSTDLVNTLSSEKVKDYCELKNENGRYEPATDFETTVGPEEIIVWKAKVNRKSASAGYTIGLDLVRMLERNSNFFERVVQLGNNGAVLAQTKSTVLPGQTEAYEIWFTITYGKGTPSEMTKTYVLDPRLKGSTIATSYILHARSLTILLPIEEGLKKQVIAALEKLLDNETGSRE